MMYDICLYANMSLGPRNHENCCGHTIITVQSEEKVCAFRAFWMHLGTAESKWSCELSCLPAPRPLPCQSVHQEMPSTCATCSSLLSCSKVLKTAQEMRPSVTIRFQYNTNPTNHCCNMLQWCLLVLSPMQTKSSEKLLHWSARPLRKNGWTLATPSIAWSMEHREHPTRTRALDVRLLHFHSVDDQNGCQSILHQ